MINLKKDLYSASFRIEYLKEIKNNIQTQKYYNFFKENMCTNYSINNVDLLLDCILTNPFSQNCRSTYPILYDYFNTVQIILRGHSYIKYQSNFEQVENKKEFYKEHRKKIIEKYQNPMCSDIIKKHKEYFFNKNNFNNLLGDIKKCLSLFNKNNLIESVFNYDLISSKLRDKILLSTKIDICPYCNRNFITSYNDLHKGTMRSSAQLDHFYPKSIFPLYGLSLANFIPSCAFCNSVLKKAKLIPLKYLCNDQNNSQEYFQFFYRDLDAILGKTSYGIDITVENSSNIYNYIHAKEFRHEEIYQVHKNHLKRLLKLRRCLDTPSYFENSKKLTCSNLSYKEFRALLYGYELSEEELLTKQLAKLSQDFLRTLID